MAQESAVRLRLSAVAGQTQFRIGQPISVALTFETTGTQSFSVSTAVRPRRLRPQTPDEFSAEPATGWVDPLRDLTWTMEGGGNPMLSRGEAIVDAKRPIVVERTLNEFIVFRKPGHYVVSAVPAAS